MGLWSLLLKGKLDDFLGNNGESLGGLLGRMKPFRGRKIVTYHRSWTYFANRFDLIIIGELEPKPGIPPTPSHLEEIIGLMKDEHAKAIVLEPYFNRKSADFVASKTGAKVAVCPASVGGAPGVKDYLTLIDFIVKQMTGVL
jgi:zinc/manganese transport system substrate-binding protein